MIKEIVLFSAVASLCKGAAIAGIGQYHSQNELHDYTFGYYGGPSSKHETKIKGVTTGEYSYVDANGKLQTVKYISDEHGFRVNATNLPKIGHEIIHEPPKSKYYPGYPFFPYYPAYPQYISRPVYYPAPQPIYHPVYPVVPAPLKPAPVEHLEFHPEVIDAKRKRRSLPSYAPSKSLKHSAIALDSALFPLPGPLGYFLRPTEFSYIPYAPAYASVVPVEKVYAPVSESNYVTPSSKEYAPVEKSYSPVPEKVYVASTPKPYAPVPEAYVPTAPKSYVPEAPKSYVPAPESYIPAAPKSYVSEPNSYAPAAPKSYAPSSNSYAQLTPKSYAPAPETYISAAPKSYASVPESYAPEAPKSYASIPDSYVQSAPKSYSPAPETYAPAAPVSTPESYVTVSPTAFAPASPKSYAPAPTSAYRPNYRIPDYRPSIPIEEDSHDIPTEPPKAVPKLFVPVLAKSTPTLVRHVEPQPSPSSHAPSITTLAPSSYELHTATPSPQPSYVSYSASPSPTPTPTPVTHYSPSPSSHTEYVHITPVPVTPTSPPIAPVGEIYIKPLVKSPPEHIVVEHNQYVPQIVKTVKEIVSRVEHEPTPKPVYVDVTPKPVILAKEEHIPVYAEHAVPVEVPVVVEEAVQAVIKTPVKMQYHSQDELGQYAFGYSNEHSVKHETKTADGVTKGEYSYVDANGEIQTVHYISDDYHGFRVAATNLPKGPVPELPHP